jgi:hypothetical protein
MREEERGIYLFEKYADQIPARWRRLNIILSRDEKRFFCPHPLSLLSLALSLSESLYPFPSLTL